MIMILNKESVHLGRLLFLKLWVVEKCHLLPHLISLLEELHKV